MIVSQYMFTACGKQKKGDFTVWAKSPDITDAEGEEIHQMMSYKSPTGVNLYEATEEQIRAACPTKYAYFMLSTGKKVLAESNFVGRVYSNQDTRWGNFFIHAYVFENLGDVLPMSILCKGKFKSKLEYKEWHDDPCPETLPQVDLPIDSVANIREIEAFLTPERKQKLLPLLQAVLNGVNGGDTVSFNDTEENQKMWYTVIGMLLPSSVRGNATFGSQIVPLFTSSVPMAGRQVAKPLVMRNIADGTSSSTFNYTMQASMNKPVFDFRNQIYGNIPVSNYVAELGNALQKSFISGLEFVKDIESLTKTYGCSADDALTLYLVKNSKITSFSSLDSYVSGLQVAERVGMITPTQFADKVYFAYFAERLWNDQTLSSDLLKKVYSNGQTGVKESIIAYYLDNCQKYGVTSTNNPDQYVEEFTRSQPFAKSDLLIYWNTHNMCARGFAKNNPFYKNYLTYSLYLEEYGKANEAIVAGVVKDILEYAVSRRAYNELDLLIGKGYAVAPNLMDRLITEITNAVQESELLYYFIETVKSRNLQLSLFKTLVANNINNSFFIDGYVDKFQRNNALYSQLERDLVMDRRYEGLQTARETYSFRKNPNVSRADLNAYFKKYFLNGRDTDKLYLGKLQEYLRRGPSPKVAFEVYDDVYTADARLAGMGQVFQLLEVEMYRPTVDEILKYPLKYAQAMESVDQKLRSVGLPVSSKCGLISFINDLTAAARDKNMQAKLMERIRLRQFYSNIKDSSQLETISRNYFVDIMELYATYRAGQTNKAYTFEIANFNLLYNLFEGVYRCRTFDDDLKNALTKISGKYYNMVMEDILIYVCYSTASYVIAPRIKTIMTSYLLSIPKGRMKKLSEAVLEDIPEKYEKEVEAFLDEKTGKGGKAEKGGIFGKRDKAEKAEKTEKADASQTDEAAEEQTEEKKSFWSTIFGKKKK